MPPTTISISFSGLCSFVADSWPEQPGEVGSPVDVLLLDTQHSAVGAQLCRHFPCMAFSEIGANGDSLVEVVPHGRRSVSFFTLAQPDEPRVVNGILPLAGLNLKFGIIKNRKGPFVPLEGVLETTASFKSVLALEALAQTANTQVNAQVSRRWRKSEAVVEGIVAARMRIVAGKLEAHAPGSQDLGVALFSVPERSFDFTEVASFAKWSFDLDADADRFVIRVHRGESLELELRFDVGSKAPQIAISNLCGEGGATRSQGASELPGDDVVSFYDLADDPEESDRRLVLRADRGVDTGTTTCPPAKQTVAPPNG